MHKARQQQKSARQGRRQEAGCRGRRCGQEAKNRPSTEKKEEPQERTKQTKKEAGDERRYVLRPEVSLIGPGVASGRVMSIAVNPKNKFEYYVGVASGGVWKTVNDGTTWTPLFDDEGSYSIGWVELDPNDSSVVWVGSGESNSQRSVGYGDGIYRSDDGGKDWKNLGPEEIGAHRPRGGRSTRFESRLRRGAKARCGDRAAIAASTNPPMAARTGRPCSPSARTPAWSMSSSILRIPDIVYAAAYQRRRHVFTLIDGGPESAIYKSTDAGETWNKAHVRTAAPSTWDASAWRSRRQIPTWSTPRSKRPMARAASSAPPTRVRHGSGATNSIRARCTTRGSCPIRRMSIASS